MLFANTLVFSQDTIVTKTDGFTRKLLEGTWYSKEDNIVIKFANDTLGSWVRNGHLSDAPLFVVREKNGEIYLIWLKILGDEGRPRRIVHLNNNKLVFKDHKTKKRYRYKRKNG
jgi:hypothetical protein